jgi:hypothetical protein
MPLKEQDRQKLDGIVSKMESNGEKSEDIQFVVNDFKSKYEQLTTSPATTGEMRGRNEQIDQGPSQVGQPFPLANRPQSPVGSLEQLNLAVEKSGNIGRVGPTNFDFSNKKIQDPLATQAGFYLGPDSARKFQKFVAGNYEPMEDEEFTDKERKFFNDYEGKRVKQVGANMVRYGGPLAAAAFIPGAQTLAGGVLTEAASELLAQTLEPEKMRPAQIAAAAIPIPSIAKQGTGTGLRRLLTSETGISQQSSLGKQVVKEMGAGGLQSGLQAGVESIGEDVSGGEIAMRTAIGTTLFPAISTGVRGAGALSRAGFNVTDPAETAGRIGRGAKTPVETAKRFAATFGGEMQRPFTQKFLEDRANLIRQELGNAAGIDPALARQVADTFYNPAFSGSSPQEVKDFQNTVQSFLEQSVVQGRRSGLSGDELTQEIIAELNKVSGRTDVNHDVVASVVRQANILTEQATSKIDESIKKSEGFKDKRNQRALAFTRRAEGRLQVEAQELKDDISRLNNERAQLSNQDIANRTQVEGKIAYLQDEIKKIEDGFDNRFLSSKPVSSFETGTFVGEQGNKVRDKFEADQAIGFGKITPRLKATTVQVDLGKVDKKGNPIIETKTLDDLKNIRSQIYRLFDFNAPVQQGFYESWQKLNKINDAMTGAFNKYPDLRDDLAAQNKRFAEGISRFKGAYVDRILRDIGEAGGAKESISAITGPRGATTLSVLKNMAGETWETDVKPALSDYVYNQIRGNNPIEFLKTLTEAKAARGKQLSKEVANEFFPSLGDIQDVASKYGSIIKEEELLKANLKDLESQSQKLQKDVSNKITGAEKRIKENESEILTGKKRLSDFQKKNADRKFQGILAQPEQDVETQKQLISLLADIKKNVKAGVVIEDDVLKQIVSNPDASKMLNELNDYVTEQAKASTDFQNVVSSAIRSGNLYGKNVPAGNIVDFLKSTGGGVYPIKRAEEFVKILKTRPELLADAQNIVLGRIVKESLVDGKKSIDTNKMKALVTGGEKPGEYNAMVNELFGSGGVDKISTIADQLSVESKKGSSLVSKSIIPTLATAGAYIASGAGPMGSLGGAAAGGLVGFIGRRMVLKAIGDSGESAIGRMLQSPTYVKTITTPIDQLSKEQIALFNRNWSRILKLETDRKMMQMEENQAEEVQLKEMQRQTRRRD